MKKKIVAVIITLLVLAGAGTAGWYYMNGGFTPAQAEDEASAYVTSV
ncbi:MAG: hypothetical protein Q4C42_03950 [Clostridia bacterium]|nr:hypothetical protein [Clostridia bacterium]